MPLINYGIGLALTSSANYDIFNVPLATTFEIAQHLLTYNKNNLNQDLDKQLVVININQKY